MSSSSRDAIIDRIKKLLKLAGDNNNEHEVESAMRFARKLMTEHGISEFEAVDTDSAKSVECHEEAACYRSGYAKWEQRLVRVANKCCDTQHFWTNSLGKTSPVFVGVARDAAVASALWLQLLVTIRTMARVRFGKGWTLQHRCYANGFVSGLYDKACAMYDSTASNPNGSIVLLKSSIVKTFMDKTYSLKSRRQNNQAQDFDPNAYARGVKDGNDTSLSTKVLK